ncbi:Cysteine--tRNA ligase, mitochondrial [Dermatophagoides pteronyssinus]|uniref:Cysteine--tRNA ligase, mitochondrial n=1 Tax=Dermatophagoides pteronyssinus TaxID=6956 RepID=A0ABQ8J286_DERPT|nr:Cysteine--tRNA ligase, mitochondrial [Dermatophagoides pteronyssinus]
MWNRRRLFQRIITIRSSSIVERSQQLSSQSNRIISFDQLELRSTFDKQQQRIIPNVAYLNRIDHHHYDSNLNLYCCGPTVYDHSHLGHAITYIRCDLIIKMLQEFCNVNIHFAMNITDIDDKIIKKSQETNVDYRQLSNEYYQSFLQDMHSLRITKPDYLGKVLDNIPTISDYIHRIYDKGFAYINSETGDLNFDYENFLRKYSIKNIPNFGSNQITEKSFGKRSPKDFALWKSSTTAKLSNEPYWLLKLPNGTEIKGRPGWHVECSAISESIFGKKIDLHFGGQDLMFPHHHCESCCSHVYQYQPSTTTTTIINDENSQKLYSNVNVWLHSGHLILRSEKMSKSLGNIFYKKYSTNILRLLCIRTHYRSEIDFDEKLLLEMSAFDEKLLELQRQIEWAIYKLSTTTSFDNNDLSMMNVTIDTSTIDSSEQQQQQLSLDEWINQIEQSIWSGLLDDMDLNRSLVKIICLANQFSGILSSSIYPDQPQSKQKFLFNLIRLRKLLQRWFMATSLDYYDSFDQSSSSTTTTISTDQLAIVEYLTEFRQNIRQSTLLMMKNLKKFQQQQSEQQQQPEQQQQQLEQQKFEMNKILEQCDQTRNFLEKHGFKLKDQRSSP